MVIVKQKYRKYVGSNPYKGFVPFIGKYNLESSMEFFYIALNKILISKNDIIWDEFENKLDEIFQRNHTAIVRIFIDYPTLEFGLPLYLKSRVKLFKYDEFGGGIELDYNNDFLIDELIKFINIFGKKCDGDNRIAFIQCGLIGHWGEWHCYPKDELMPSIYQLEKIIHAYLVAFKMTKIMVRNPKYKFLKKYNIGFHDDSFCYSTLPTKDYHFVTQLRKNNLVNHYLNNPIGGEVRPEEQEKLIFNKSTKEDYFSCVKNTNCSWLIIQSAFNQKVNSDYIYNLSSRLGYDFYIDNIEIKENIISFILKNIGVAPIYYDFDCILNVTYNNKIKKIKLDYDLRKLLPNNEFRFSFNIKSISKFDELSFSLERDNQVINLSNSNKNGNLVILCTK